MAQQPIIFGNTQESGSERLSGASPVAINVVVDPKGTVRRRPGIATYSGIYSEVINSNGIDGIYTTNNGKVFVVGSNNPSSGGPYRNIYKVTAGGFSNLSQTKNDAELAGSSRPTFAETEALVVVAGGLNIQKIELATDSCDRLGGTPPKSTHVLANSLRLLANDATVDLTKVRYTEVSGASASDYSAHEDWSFGGVGLAGFFPASARSDPIQAIYENTNEVFVFGTTNVQIFGPDQQYAYLSTATREFGLSAPYSVIKVDQDFAWLDQYQRIVLSDGREFKVISGPIGATLNELSTVSDCFGYRVQEDPIDCLVWSFPTEGRTFAYQQGSGWSQWQGYDWNQNNWKNLDVNCHTHDQNNNVNLVGTGAGKVRQLSMGVADDDGERINAYVETGFLDRGTDARKHCVSVRMAFERGTVTGSTAPVGFLQYADSPDNWSEPLKIDLDTTCGII
jgi:hypothetical protein